MQADYGLPWSFIDRPAAIQTGLNSNAAFSAPTAASTNVTPIDQPGTYLIELAVNSGQGLGATADDVARITFYAALVGDPYQGVLNPNPSLLPRRIPAFGERREHNAPDTLEPAGNTTGWAREWLRIFRWAMVNMGAGGGGSGDVVGPASSVDNTLAGFSGLTGKLIKEAGTIQFDPANDRIWFNEGVFIVTPPLTGTVHNFNPGGDFYSYDHLLKLQSTGTLVISGMAAADPGRPMLRYLYNGNPTVPGDVVTLLHNGGGSTSTNRFLISSGANLTLLSGAGVWVLYDHAQQRWLVYANDLGSVLAAGNTTRTGQLINVLVTLSSGATVYFNTGDAFAFGKAGVDFFYFFVTGGAATMQAAAGNLFELTTVTLTGQQSPGVRIRPSASLGDFSGGDVDIHSSAGSGAAATEAGAVRIWLIDTLIAEFNRAGDGSLPGIGFFGQDPAVQQDGLPAEFGTRRSLDGLYIALEEYGLLDSTARTSGQRTPPITNVNAAASPYTVLISDELIQVDTTAGAVSLAVPDKTQRSTFLVKDVAGTFATNACTLLYSASSPDTGPIEGATANKVLSINRGAWSVYSDGLGTYVNGPS